MSSQVRWACVTGVPRRHTQRQRRDHRAVGPRQPWTSRLPLQHRKLMRSSRISGSLAASERANSASPPTSRQAIRYPRCKPTVVVSPTNRHTRRSPPYAEFPAPTPATRRAQRRGVHVVVAHPVGGKRVEVRRRDRAAVAAEVPEAGVVEDNQQHLRQAGLGPHRPGWTRPSSGRSRRGNAVPGRYSFNTMPASWVAGAVAQPEQHVSGPHHLTLCGWIPPALVPGEAGATGSCSRR